MNTRERLRQEIETTRLAFHQMLDSIPEEDLSLPSGNPAWNVRQVLYHIAMIPGGINFEVTMIRKQVKLYQLLPRLVPKSTFDWLNTHVTRLGARRMTRQRLVDVYDRSCQVALQSLASVSDADFEISLYYPLWDPLLTGDVTIAYLFGYIKRHYDSHTTQIEKAIHRKFQPEVERLYASQPKS